MSEQNSWRYFTVHDFFEKYNWSGQTKLLPILSAENSDASESILTTATNHELVENWQNQTVQIFLSQFNWTGRAVRTEDAVATSQKSADDQGSSSLQHFSIQLAVKDFFNSFIWESQPNIGTIPKVTATLPIEVEDELSLNDFSSMF